MMNLIILVPPSVQIQMQNILEQNGILYKDVFPDLFPNTDEDLRTLHNIHDKVEIEAIAVK